MATAAESTRTVVEPAPFGADPARSVRASITQASVERAFAILLAMAAIGLGIVDAPAVLEQLPYLDPFWGPTLMLALAASFVFIGVSAFVQRVAQPAQIVCALLFLVVLVTWTATVQEPIPSSQQPWPWWFCTVGCTAAAMGFATWRATVYTALVPAVYVVIRLSPLGGDVGVLAVLLDGVYTALLSGAVLVIAVVLRRAATAVDTAQSTAVRRYSLAIREHATEVERVQVDAIVHDSVLTTLLSAARADTLEAKTLAARMARNAIDHLEAAATDGPGDVAPVALGELRARIREGGCVARPGPPRPDADRVGPPARVGRRCAGLGVAAGRGEQRAARRRRRRHALGPHRAAGPGVLVEVGDDGRGFDVAAIPAERLGVRRSIVERVATVDGRAEVHTAPGEGTRIVLTWSPADRTTA